MVFDFDIPIPTRQESIKEDLWQKAECYRFYAQQRKANCNYLEKMDLWLRSPYCVNCAVDNIGLRQKLPDISSNNWKSDVLYILGDETYKEILKYVKNIPDYSFICKNCSNTFRPWKGDDIYVVQYHLEEHYNIPIEMPERKKASKILKKMIFDFYNNECFRCGSSNKELHIDHIMPQSAGGDAAFRNLQPLCEGCGNEKGDKRPIDVTVYSDMLFEPPPHDTYPHLFW